MKMNLLRSAALLSAGQMVSYGCSFIRNLILARMLAKADFGLAAAFSMTLTMLELAGRMAFGVQIVQAKEGASERFLGTSHTFQFLLSTGTALLVAVTCVPIAHAFKVPHAWWAFATLALIPLLKGFEHLGIFVQQRERRYLPAVLSEAVPQLLVTAATWPLALWLGDFRVILVVMVAKSGLTIVMTHVTSSQPYRWAMERGYMRSIFRFSLPLLLNGLLMFVSQQGDQMMVGTFLSLSDLALYSIAFSVVSIPWFVFARVTSQLILPILSRCQDDDGEFNRQYQFCQDASTIASVLVLAPLIAAGGPLVELLYGAKYHDVGPILAILGVTCGLRFLRLAPTMAATARADTVNQLYSNLWRGMSLPLAFAAAALGGGLLTIAACSVVAEVAAGALSILRLSRKNGVPLRENVPAVLLTAVTLGAAYGAARFAPHVSLVTGAGMALGAVLVSVVVSWFLMPETCKVLLVSLKQGLPRAGHPGAKAKPSLASAPAEATEWTPEP